MKVGGIAGIGATDASAKVSLQKTDFHVGEGINVHIEMDNTACSKPVKSYKFKLRRVIKCLGRKQAVHLEKEEYLITIKEPGCEPKMQDTKDYTLEIPVNDKSYGKTDTLHPELR